MPENERSGFSQVNRYGRRWLIGSATLSALGLITGACAPRPTPTPERKPTEIPNPLEIRIQQAVEALPQSPLKDLARQALPYFSYPKPATRDYAGVSVIFLGSRFNYFPNQPISEGRSSVRGVYTLRRSIDFIPEPAYAIEPTTIKIPLLYLVRPEEKIKIIPKDIIDVDGTVFAPFDYYTNKTRIYEGILPVLELYSPANSATGSLRELVRRLEDFILVKEVLTAALADTWILEVVKTMKEKCWPIYLIGAKSDQKPYILEALSQSIIEITNQRGRFNTLLDLGAEYAAVNAVEGTAVANDLRYDQYSSPMISLLQGISLGASPQEILSKVFSLAINTPSEYIPPYISGNIKSIP